MKNVRIMQIMQVIAVKNARIKQIQCFNAASGKREDCCASMLQCGQ
jgi:hypothetical protein